MANGSLHLFHSSGLEPLLKKLAEHLAVPLSDPFAPERIVVPTPDIKAYLKRELARFLGALQGDDGIVANIEFVSPRQLINATAVDAVVTDASAWDANSLSWAIVDVVLGNSNIHVPGFDRAPLTVARRVADLFDRYASHRPEMLQHWLQGGVDDGTDNQRHPNSVSSDQRWQVDLFREVAGKYTRDGVPQRAIDDVVAHAKSVAESLPESSHVPRLSVFGISTLTKSARQILEALSTHWNVSIYMVYPAGSNWPDVAAAPLSLRSEFSETKVKHHLTSRWSAQTVESATLFGSVSRTYLPESATDRSLLSDLKTSILDDVHMPTAQLTTEQRTAARASGDGSIQVHACYGLGRQVEALRDAILHQLNRDPSLKLRDIAVLCNDIEQAAPILSAVFAPDRETGGTLRRLPINVLGGGSSTENPVVEAFMAVLRLFSSRCTPTEVLDVAHLGPVRRRFGFDDDALDLLSTWAEDLSVSWGIDAALRAEQWNVPAGISNGSWDVALDRLMVGVAVPGEVDRIGPGNVVPYDGIGGSEIGAAGQIAEFIARVARFARIVNDPAGLTFDTWCTTMRDAIDSFIDVSGDDRIRLVRLKSAISAFQRDMHERCGRADTTFGVRELTEMLSGYFADERGSFGNLHESITVAAFDGLENIPYRVIAILGADESTFTGARSDGDDILANHPCVGERIYSLDGRQRLLDAVMAARDTLIVTCTGADISNNKELPLAVPLQDLLEFVDVFLHEKLSAGKPYGSQQVLARHPRQNFDSRTLSPGLVFADAPFTFDPQAREAHEVLKSKGVAADAEVTANRDRDTSFELTKFVQPTLKNLVEVITRPTDFYVHSILDVRVPKLPSSSGREDKNITGEGILPLTIDNLRWAKEGRELLDKIVSSPESLEDTLVLWEVIKPLTRTLPPKQLGALVVEEIRDELKMMIKKLPAPLQTLSAGTDIDGTVTVAGRPSSFRIQNVHSTGFARVRYRRFIDSMILEPWVELSILTLITDGTPYQAHLVARAPKSSSKDPVYRHFALKGDSPEARLASAAIVLSCLEGMHRAASIDAPPFFERASFALETKGEHKAETALDTDLQYSAPAAHLFGHLDPEVIFETMPAAGDYKALGLHAPDEPESRAQLYARHVWGTFRSTTTMITEAGDASDESTEEEY
jgi:exodeoxyribonuclease V gamma subunit